MTQFHVRIYIDTAVVVCCTREGAGYHTSREHGYRIVELRIALVEDIVYIVAVLVGPNMTPIWKQLY